MTERTGFVDLSQRQSDGWLRQMDQSESDRPNDPLLPHRLIQKHGLRTGMQVKVLVSRHKGSEPVKGRRRKKKRSRIQKLIANAPRVDRVLEIEGGRVEDHKALPSLEELTTIDPQPQIKLEYPGCPPVCRLMDLFCPIGWGQRGMIVSPPKAGKTMLLQQVATAISPALGVPQ